MISDAIVQTDSIVCPSKMNNLICLFWIIHIWWVPVVLSPGVNRVVKVTIYLQLVPRLRMSGAVPLFTVYALMAWTGTYYTHTHKHLCVFPAEKHNRNEVSVTDLCAIQTSCVCGLPFI
jgi:hypothetical protein